MHYSLCYYLSHPGGCPCFDLNLYPQLRVMNKVVWDYSQENLFLMRRKKEQGIQAFPARRSDRNSET